MEGKDIGVAEVGVRLENKSDFEDAMVSNKTKSKPEKSNIEATSDEDED